MEVRLTSDVLFVERGLPPSDAQQISLVDVFDVNLSQGRWQQMAGVAEIRVHVHGRDGFEITVLEDMPDFDTGARLILEAARHAGNRQEQAATVHHLAPAISAAPRAPPPGPAAAHHHLMAQLRRLANLHRAELITDEEYRAKNAQLSGRLEGADPPRVPRSRS